MLIYLVLILIILFLGIAINPRRSRQRRKAFLFLSFLDLTVISGLRDYSVGADTEIYVSLFNSIDFYNMSSSRFESGYLYFMKLVHRFSDNPTVFLFLCSIICIGAACHFIYVFSDDPLLSVLLYVVLKPYFFQMTGLRQALAISINMMAFLLILDKRTKRRSVLSLALMFLAPQFHSVAYISFIPYILFFFPRIRNRLRMTPSSSLKWTILISAVAFLAFPFVLDLILYIAPHYIYYLSGTWGDSNYFASLFNTLIQMAFMVVGVIYLRRFETTDLEKFALIMLSMTIISVTLSMRLEIIGRISTEFSIYTGILFAPMFTSVVEEPKNRLLLKSMVFLSSFAYLLVTFIFRPEWDGVVPYIFI